MTDQVLSPALTQVKRASRGRRIAKWLAILCLAAVVVAELGLRLAGIVDFPLYDVDSAFGYIPKPNQSGVFLHRNAWVYNDRSMGVATPWNPAAKPNVLLVGNSVIMGGDPYNQPDKLGPKLQALLGSQYSVWPIASGGWTTVNETAYLERNADVAQSAHLFVWEYMAGSLSGLSAWRGQYILPSEPPISAIWYVFRHYVLPGILSLDNNALPPTGPVQPQYLAEFRDELALMSKTATAPAKGIIFLYPVQWEYLKAAAGQEWLPDRADVMKLAAEFGLTVVDVARDPRWNADLYRDGTHPTVQGNVVLAAILADAIKPRL